MAGPQSSRKAAGQQQQQAQSGWSDVGAVLRTAAIIGLFFSFMVLPSGDYTWPAAWLSLAAVVCLTMVPTFLYTKAHNPDLVRERERGIRHANTAGFDVLLVPAVSGLIPIRLLAAGWQHRVQLQQGLHLMPFLSTPAQQAAAVVLVCACLLQTWAVCTNKFFSSVVRIQTDRGHHVCCMGPYAYVRHPGYIAFSLQGIAESVLFQSPWAMAFALAKVAVLVVRTVHENAFLKASLPGYAAYAQRVRYSWVPLLW